MVIDIQRLTRKDNAVGDKSVKIIMKFMFIDFRCVIINKPHLRSLSLNHVIEHANADAKLIGCGRALVFKLQGRESSETC